MSILFLKKLNVFFKRTYTKQGDVQVGVEFSIQRIPCQLAIVLVPFLFAISSGDSLDTNFLKAALKADLYLMDSLRIKGADINAKSNFGMSSIMLACQTNNLEMARYLIKNGAAVNDKNFLGNSALDIASTYRSGFEMVRLLIDAGAKIESSNLVEPIKRNDIHLVKFLLDKGANPRVIIYDTVSALRFSIIHGMKEIEAEIKKSLAKESNGQQ